MAVSFFEQGFEIINGLLSADELASLDVALGNIELEGKTGGIRHADKKIKAISELALSKKLVGLAQCYLLEKPALVRVILFDKTPENNWLVTWHQDRTLAVSAKFDAESWGPWSMKEGVHHVQPPQDVLDQMITCRIHLDDSHEKNGCLNIMPQSHKLGLIPLSKIKNYVSKKESVACVADAGSVLVMRPHLLHSSSKAIMPSRRRVIHIEYSCYELPVGISWA